MHHAVILSDTWRTVQCLLCQQCRKCTAAALKGRNVGLHTMVRYPAAANKQAAGGVHCCNALAPGLDPCTAAACCICCVSTCLASSSCHITCLTAAAACSACTKLLLLLKVSYIDCRHHA
jgi:hypothetical protein